MSSDHQNEIVTGSGTQTEQATRAFELSYRRIFEATRDGLLILDADTGRIRDVNPSLMNLLGFSRGEMIGQTFGELGLFNHHESCKLMFERLQHDGCIHCDHLPLEMRDGRKIAVELVGNVYPAGDKKMIQCNLRDITGHRQAAEKLKLFRAVAEQSHHAIKDAVKVVDPATGRFLDVNETACRMLGYTRDELLALTVFDVDPAVDRAAFDTFKAELIRLGHLNLESRHRRKDGTMFPVEVSVSQVKLDREYVVTVARDITERRQTEEKLKLLRALVEQSHDATKVLDPATGRFLEVNEAACRMLGYTREELLALTVFDVNPDIDRAAYEKNGAEAGRLGRLLVESRHRRKDGTTFPVEISVSQIELDRVYGVTVARDITERKQAEQELQKVNRALRLISLCNQELVRATDEAALLQAVCRLAVEHGGYRLAWVGFAEQDAAKSVRPVAQAGFEAGYLDTVNITWADVERGRGPVGTAIRTGQPAPVRDFLTDPACVPWRAEASQRGYASCIALPLIIEGRCIGALTIYAGEPEAFDPAEVELLNEMAGDLAYGIGALRHRGERRRAMEAVRESERRFQTLANTSPVGIFQTDARGQTTYVNPRWCEISGLSAAEATGEGWLRAVHPEDREKLAHGWRTATQAQCASKVDYRFVHPDGTISWVMGQAVPEQDQAGHIVGYVGTITDITERKRADEAVRESRAFYHSLVEQLPAGIFRKDAEGRYVFVSPSFCRLKGMKAEDFLGKTALEVAGSPSAQQDATGRAVKYAAHGESHHREIMRTGKPIELIEEYATADGEKSDECRVSSDTTTRPAIPSPVTRHPSQAGKQFVQAIKIPVIDPDGKIIGTQGILFDITERKRADESYSRLVTAVEQAAETIIITDTQGTILYVNPAFEKSSGYTRAEALGRNPRLLKSGKQDAGFYRRMWEALGRGEIWSGRIINRRKDGALYEEEATLSPVRDAAGTIVNYVAVKRDVTREVQLEAQMHQAQKMEAVGQLAGGVAHDFNNILGVILGYTDLLASDLEPDSPLHKYAEEIRQAAERATGLTQQLLVFSRKQKVQLVVLDLNDTVMKLEKMLRRLIGENIEMQMVPGKAAGSIKADSGYIGQVLMNLAVNARDAMPHGGKLTIATDRVTLGENQAGDETRDKWQVTSGTNKPPADPGTRHPSPVTGGSPVTRKAGNYVRLTVSDTGSGMTPEVKARIFEALFTTKPAGKGTGLGLATCQTIVQQSGGHIEVVSEAGKGATFRIYFPRVEQPVEAPASDAGGHAGTMPRGTETLLVVEDEAPVRHLAWKVLESLGYRVLRANNGQDALQLAREHKGPPIRLAVTDVVMPRMGGKVMADWLKTTYPDLKILFTSGYTDDALAQQGVLEPGVAFLPKPYTPAVLAGKVRAMLDNQTDPTASPAETPTHVLEK